MSRFASQAIVALLPLIILAQISGLAACAAARPLAGAGGGASPHPFLAGAASRVITPVIGGEGPPPRLAGFAPGTDATGVHDELGYIIPGSQWDEEAPFAYGRDAPQYGETNSAGPRVAMSRSPSCCADDGRRGMR